MKLRELKKAKPATMKSSGSDDPKKYVGGWETYDKPQGIGDRQDRKVLAKEEEHLDENTPTAPLNRFAPDPQIADLEVGAAEQAAIDQSRKAPSKQALASAKALSARGKQPKLKPQNLDETIRRPFLGTLNREYEIADDQDATIGYAKVTDGVIETFDYLTEATQDYRGQIMSALLHQIVFEADRNQANLSIMVEGMNGEIKSLLERFGFRLVGGSVMKRNQGAIRPTSVPAPQGMVNRED